MLKNRSRSGCTEGGGAGQCIAALNGDGNPLPEETGFTPVPRDHSHATTQLRNEKLSLVASGSERFEREGMKECVGAIYAYLAIFSASDDAGAHRRTP